MELANLKSAQAQTSSKPKRSTFLEPYKENFETLRRAFSNGDVALVQCQDVESENFVAVIAAVNRAGKEMEIIPFARMFTDNPYEQLRPPNSDGSFGTAVSPATASSGISP